MPEISSTQGTQNPENELLDGRLQCKVITIPGIMKGGLPFQLTFALPPPHAEAAVQLQLQWGMSKKENFMLKHLPLWKGNHLLKE